MVFNCVFINCERCDIKASFSNQLSPSKYWTKTLSLNSFKERPIKGEYTIDSFISKLGACVEPISFIPLIKLEVFKLIILIPRQLILSHCDWVKPYLGFALFGPSAIFIDILFPSRSIVPLKASVPMLVTESGISIFVMFEPLKALCPIVVNWELGSNVTVGKEVVP